MATYIPVTLQGTNLKERHRYLNALVKQAYEENIPIKDIIEIPERSAIDRIFKIELASLYKYTEFIIQNLKDDDILFVSRSLKCFWLLDPEYKDIIDPSYLENVLYPEMIQPAVNKMKQWLQLNLKDSARCREFYKHYKDNIDDAINFFWHCSQDFILSEFPNIIDKLTPGHVEILFEVCPAACGVYFEILPNNRPALQKYVNDRKYFNCVRYLLKYNGNLFMDIVENYFNTSQFETFSPSVTKYVMKNYKSRVLAKIELYASSILHLETIASFLTSEEAKEVVMKFARAEFLSQWFSYKKIEPILKRVKTDERTALKKQVFVDKAIGDMVKEWPYPQPEPLKVKEESEEYEMLSDIEQHPYMYKFYYAHHVNKRRLMKKCGRYYNDCPMAKCAYSVGKSPLDKLFDRYRFDGFEKTFNELSKNLLAEGTIEGRLNMMLVLISKSGGVSEQVEKLLSFLVKKHLNEPNTLRAAVIRSLVKRECVWRVPNQVWDLLLKLGWDLGLDGAKTELVCREGLHCVIIRHLLNDTPIPQSLLLSFLERFSALSEYKLNVDEKRIIAKRLPETIVNLNPGAFLDCLTEYKLNINDFPDAKPVLIKAAKEDSKLARRLFYARILRRELLKDVFPLEQNDAMYVNVLRHDTELLEDGKIFATLISKRRSEHERFLRSLCLYFSEPGGLAEQHQTILKKELEQQLNQRFVRPLCTLTQNPSLIKLIESFANEKSKDRKRLRILSHIKSNVHKSKPVIDIDAVDWEFIGTTAVANKVLICRSKQREIYLKKLLERKQTANISLRLSHNTPNFIEVFLRVCVLKPVAALKVGLKQLFKNDNIDIQVWDALKTIIDKKKKIAKDYKFLQEIEDPRRIAKNVVADYWVCVFKTFMKIEKKAAMPMLCRIENILPDVDRQFVGNIVKDFIDVDLRPEKFDIKSDEVHDHDLIRTMYFRIVAKHLLLCKSEDEQENLLKNVCDRFFDAIEVLFKTEENKQHIIQSLDGFVLALKCTKSFTGGYVSCTPVFERVIERLRNILPIRDNFDTYAEIHLTMLYCRAIKEAIEIKSDIFDDPKNRKEGIEIIAEIFGKFVGCEVNSLVTRYSRTVVDFYKQIMHSYLRKYFEYNNTMSLFITFLLKGILKVESVDAYLLAEYIFKKEQYCVMKPHDSEILKTLKKSDFVEVRFFTNAHISKTNRI